MFISCDNPSDSNDDNSTIDSGNNTSFDNNNSTDNNGNSNSNGENSGNSNDNNSNSGNNNNNSSNDDNKDDNESPSSNLPENVGENPIKETIKLNREGYIDEFYLELKADGAAIYGDDKHNEIRYELKYAYDETKKEIYMKVEKCSWNGVFSYEESQLMTYDELLSRFNEALTINELKKELKEQYENNKDEEWFEETYPNCNSYDDFEAEVMRQGEFDSFADYVKSVKQNYEAMYRAYFSAQTTYGYEIENDKMALTEKFTGVKNMFSETGCHFSIDDSIYGGIHNSLVYYYENDAYYTGIPNTEKKTIVLQFADGQKPEEGLKLDATYTEDIDQKTVTIKVKDKEYVCKFYGQKFIQE